MTASKGLKMYIKGEKIFNLSSTNLLSIKQPTSLIKYTYGNGYAYLVTQRMGKLSFFNENFTRSKLVINISKVDPEFSTEDMEEGLLSCAPLVSQNKLFLSYTKRTNDKTFKLFLVIATLDLNTKQLSTFMLIPFRETYHHSGTLVIKGDYLYLSTGDGGPQGDPYMASQPLNTLWGKILRINLYNKSIKILATGLRNPWRYSISNNIMMIGDVGYKTSERVYSLNLKTKHPVNYGWSCIEGSHIFKPCGKMDKKGRKDKTSFKLPLFEYPTSLGGDKGSAIIGGYLLNSKTYVCFDYCGDVRIIQKQGKRWIEVGYKRFNLKIYSSGIDEKRGIIFILAEDGIHSLTITKS